MKLPVLTLPVVALLTLYRLSTNRCFCQHTGMKLRTVLLECICRRTETYLEDIWERSFGWGSAWK